MDSAASSSLTGHRPLRIGDEAPDFTARTTCGQRSLTDYRGQWLLLFAHPADFTPVCTSEFVGLAKAEPLFESIGCKLLGISVDSLYAHLAWLRDIHRQFGVEVAFPIIEDPSMVIAHAYGMLDPNSPDSSAVRASYVIDPNGIIRAMSWYPMNVGRSIEEQLRLVKALQAAEKTGASTPADWTEGMSMLEPAPTTLDHTIDGPKNGLWYYRERSR